MTDSIAAADTAVYYGSDYWNDLDEVRRMINRRISGDPEVFWDDHFRASTGRTFERALILNCGNGHVEEGLAAKGIAAAFCGIDFADDLLDQARARAAAGGYEATYVRMDTNSADFPDEPFDLVVNHAAAHHIARIDRVLRELCRRLPEDGCIVSWDYTGPHRNQYPYEIWDAAHRVNQELPEHLRQDMRYPHLPTMLATDPSEAVHSELILPTLERYFTITEHTPVGGAIAYLLLTHNAALHAAPADERAPWVEHVLAADAAFLDEHPEHNLFAYFCATPDKAVLERTEDLERWTGEEEAREAAAADAGGEYYPRTALQDLALRFEDQRMATEHARLDLAAATAPLPKRLAHKVAATSWGRRLREDPRVGRLEQRLRG